MGSILKFESVDVTLNSDAGAVHILKKIDLDVPAGKTVSLVGPSGSGKTTLLMVAAGLERANAGRVTVVNTVLNDLSEDALAVFRRDHIGIVFQNFHLFATMTALENVAVPLELAGVKDAFDRAQEALSVVGLGHRLHHYPRQLSGGEQQRVAVARVFAVRPKLILADEPTGNLDVVTGQVVMQALFDVAQKHQSTLLLITHDAGLAARCDVSVHLRDGQVVAS